MIRHWHAACSSRGMRQVMWTVLGGVALAWPSSALACGATPDGQFKLLGFSPEDGAVDVAPNEPIVFRFACTPGEQYGADLRAIICDHGPSALEVALKAEGSDTALVGDVVRFGDVAIFRPLEPLAADTTYLLSAVFREGSDEAQGEGPHEASFQFRTGTAPHAAPSADAMSERVSESYEARVARCRGWGEDDDEVRLVGQAAEQELGPQYCPGTYEVCEPDGTARAPRMRLVAGSVSGPLAALGYGYAFEVTNERTGQYLYGNAVHAAAGERVAFTWDYPEEVEGNRACARLTVSDADERQLTLYDACFDVAEARAELGFAPSEAEESGCRLTQRASRVSLLSVFGLVTLTVCRRRKRRQ